MLAATKNYDISCYYLRVVHNSLDNFSKGKIDSFIELIRNDLFNKAVPLKVIIKQRLPLIFNIRMSAFKLISSRNENLSELIDNEVYPYFEQMAAVERLSGISENILFALRCNRKVVKALTAQSGEQQFTVESFADIADITFEQFLGLLNINTPGKGQTAIISEWMKCTLQIEYCICATSLINDEKLMISNERINELSSIIVDAAQNYSAIALETGIWPVIEKSYSSKYEDYSDENFIKEQKELAEAGISSFTQNWD